MWEWEAVFASSRHRVLNAYLTAYEHAVEYGADDLFGLASNSVPETYCNHLKPRLLAARQTLRRCVASVSPC